MRTLIFGIVQKKTLPGWTRTGIGDLACHEWTQNAMEWGL